MFKEEITVQNEAGLHARPASLFVKESSKFNSDIKIIKEDKEYNGKSIMSILSIGVGKGDKITICAEGEDEEVAVAELVDLLLNRLNE